MKINRSSNSNSRFCIKIYGLVCAESGFLYNFEVYSGGRGPAAEVRHGAESLYPPEADGSQPDPGGPGIVALFFRLLGRLARYPYTVYLDRWFNSLSLVLAAKRASLAVVGTVLTNRGYPDNAKFAGSEERGEVIWSTHPNGEVVALGWYDSKPVYFLCSLYVAPSGFVYDTVFRNLAAGRKVEISRPLQIERYNFGMGGCDAIDANVAHYDIHIPRLKRWWLNLLFWIVSILLNQAWVIHEWLRRERDGDVGKSSRKAFRLAVAQGMIDYAGKLARSAGVEVLLSNRRPSRGFRCLRRRRPPLQHLPSVAAPPRRSLLRRTTAGLRQLAPI